MFGIRISLLLFLLTFQVDLYCQVSCTPPSDSECDDKCGGVSIGLSTDDNSIFCQSENVTIEIDKLKTSDFDSFFVYWCDGSIGRFGKNEYIYTHSYSIPEEEICKRTVTEYFIWVRGKKYCTEGASCRLIGVNLKIKHGPRSTFNTKPEVCIDQMANFQSQSCNVDASLPDAYIWDFGDGNILTGNFPNPTHKYNAPGFYTVKLTVKNSCGSDMSEPQTINVVGYPNSDFSISANVNNNKICVGDTVCLIDKSNQWAKNINFWSFPTNNVFTDTLNWKLISSIRKKEKKLPADTIAKLDTIKFIVLRPTTPGSPLKFTLTADNECGPPVSKMFELNVIDRPNTNIQGIKIFCETGTYLPTLTNTTNIDSVLWKFQSGSPSTSKNINPGSIFFSKPGTFNIEATVYYSCGSIKLNETITVYSRDPVNITKYKKTYCFNSTEKDTLLADRTGGSWKMNGQGLSSGGVFTPSLTGEGSYIITYTIGPPECQSTDTVHIKVVKSVAINISPKKYCENENIDTLVANPTGGIWLGLGIIDSIKGIFDPTKAIGGLNTIQYKYDDGNCISNTPVSIQIDLLPTFSLKDSSTFCTDGGPILLTEELVTTFVPNGSTTTFYINNIQVPENYNLNSLAPNTYSVKAFHQQGECIVSDTGRIHIIAKTTLSLPPNDTVCINDGTFQLTASPAGGTWSGPGVNPATGVINLNVAMGGVKMYNYVFEKGTSCEVSGSVNIKINDPANNLNIGADTAFCYGPTVLALTASPGNGTWNGQGVQPSFGIIDLTQLKTDIAYTYQYCVNDNAIANCQACKSKTITILSLPQPAFVHDTTTCLGEVITFTNTTPPGSYDPTTVRWDFGDGITSSLNPSLTHTYNVKNNYTVTLSLTKPNGCSNSISQLIRVTTPPTVGSQLMLPPNNCAPFTLSALNLSNADGAFTSYWTLNGKRYDTHNFGPLTIDSLLDVKHYTLTLYTTNECGTVSKSDTFSVRPYPRVEIGLSKVDGCSPLEVSFGNSTLGRPTSYYWDLGNGNFSTDSVPPVQTYTTNDTTITEYTIRLIARNDCGADTQDRVVKVFPPNVRAFIESPGDEVCQYDSLTFLAFSTPGATNTWEIVSPDGKLAGVSGDTATIRFEESGRYKILLYAANCGIHSDSTFVNVVPAPVVDFTLPNFACMADTVSFTNTSPDLAGSHWDFGDGSTSDESNPQHAYATPGTYTIRLTGRSLVYDCEHSITKEIKIVGKPTASFAADVLNGCQPLPVQFTNQSSNGLLYEWDFGDGSGIATGPNPKHTYHNSGTFKASLRVYDENNCFADTAVLNVIIHPKPVADFSFDDQKYCLGYDSIHVQNTSTGAVGYVWQFQNQIDTLINTTFWPTAFGNFDIELMATSDRSCKDTIVKTITVLPSAMADFTTNKVSGCEDLQVDFSNNSQHSDRYIWYFGNGVSSVNRDTSYLYTSHGSYEASLIAINDNGCPNDTLSTQITVHPKPVAAFDFAKDRECGVPMQVTFTNTSTYYNDAQWLINGSPVSQDLDFVYTFTEDKTYAVQLLVENEFTCKDTVPAQVPIYHQPIAQFEVPDEACEREEITIENLSQNAVTYEWTIEGKGQTTQSSPTIDFDEAGQYHIRLIAVYNALCKDTLDAAVPITIFTRPTADFDYTTGYNNEIKGEVQFTQLAKDFTSLLWNFGDDFTSTELNPMHEYNINRPITVVLYAYHNNDGLYTCTDSISKEIEPEWIKTFYAPSALAPDHGDDIVKVFKPVGVGIAQYHISIFSPWGEKVWESTELDDNGSPTGAWDGSYKGKCVPQGAYTWRADIKWQDGNTEKVLVGSVMVVR